MRVVCKDSNHILNSLTINNTYDVISYWSSTNDLLDILFPFFHQVNNSHMLLSISLLNK